MNEVADKIQAAVEHAERVNDPLPPGTYRIAFAGTNTVEEVRVHRLIPDRNGHPITVVCELGRAPGQVARVPWSSIVLALEVTLDPTPEGDGEVRSVPPPTREG